MKIAVLSAAGKAGKLITQEALAAGFEVVAFVRDSTKLADIKSPKLKVVQKDIFVLEKADLQGYDAIVDAFGVVDEPSLFDKQIRHLNELLKGDSARLFVVGGAGSLYVSEDKSVRLLDTPDFPDIYKPVASAHAGVLDFLRQSSLNWVYVSPAAEFVFEAPKSGKYEIIGEFFKTNAQGQSKVSYADYALAMIELIKDKSINKQRVGVIGL